MRDNDKDGRGVMQLDVQFDIVLNYRDFYMILYRERHFWWGEEVEELFTSFDRHFISSLQSTIRHLYSNASKVQAYNLAFLINAQLLAYMLLLIEGNHVRAQCLTKELRRLLDDAWTGLYARQSSGALPLRYFEEPPTVRSVEDAYQEMIEFLTRLDSKESWINAVRHIQTLDLKEHAFVVKSTLEGFLQEATLSPIHPVLGELTELLFATTD